MPQKTQTKAEVEAKTNSSCACAPIHHVNTQDDLLVNEVVEIVDVIGDGNRPVPSPVVLPPEFFQ